MCERVENVSIGERERRGEREQKKEGEREEKEKEGEGEESLSLFIHIFFFSVGGTLHFISVFGRTVMTWQHSSLPLLSLTVFLSVSSTHTHTPMHSLFPSPSLSPSVTLFPLNLFAMSEILFQWVRASFIEGLRVY